MFGLPQVATRLILMALFAGATTMAGYMGNKGYKAIMGLFIGVSIILLFQWLHSMGFVLITKVY